MCRIETWLKVSAIGHVQFKNYKEWGNILQINLAAI